MVSTVIATRALEPLPALLLAAAGEIIGLFALGHAVAHTVGVRLVSIPSGLPGEAGLWALVCALAGALVWNTTMWRLGFPSSSSHAILGGLVGAIAVAFGAGAVRWNLLVRILIGLGAVPLLAAGTALLLSRGIDELGQRMTPAASPLFRGLHIVALAGVAIAHGSNDGQKSLALGVLAFSAAGLATASAAIPLWASLAVGGVIASGVILGSRRTVQTLGRRLYRIEPLPGMCAEASTMLLVGASSITGYPMSTSHVMSSSVMGVGAARRPRSVRWGLARDIALAWIFTIPCSAMVAGGLSYVVSKAI